MNFQANWLRLGATGIAGVIFLASFMGCSGSEEKVEAAGKKRTSIMEELYSASESGGSHGALKTTLSTGRGLVRKNVPTDFNPDIENPQVGSTAFVDPLASVIGNVEIGKRVYLAPFSSVRGDEGQPIHIGDESNLQDGVVIHALETIENGRPRPEHTYLVHGKRYAVYIGNRVSLAHQSHVHGPAWIEDDVFLGMQSLVFKAHIKRGSVVEPAATIIGVTIPAGRYVKAGSVVTDQNTANRLPRITKNYAFRTINKAVVHVNTSLADGYSGRGSTGGHAAPTGTHSASAGSHAAPAGSHAAPAGGHAAPAGTKSKSAGSH